MPDWPQGPSVRPISYRSVRPLHRIAFRRGIEQFNAGHFFEAHETWEEVWLHSPEPDKTFLQGIIQIAAAFHHRSRGNDRGTPTLLQAGLKRLARFPPCTEESRWARCARRRSIGSQRCASAAWAGTSRPENPVTQTTIEPGRIQKSPGRNRAFPDIAARYWGWASSIGSSTRSLLLNTQIFPIVAAIAVNQAV